VRALNPPFGGEQSGVSFHHGKRLCRRVQLIAIDDNRDAAELLSVEGSSRSLVGWGKLDRTGKALLSQVRSGEFMRLPDRAIADLSVVEVAGTLDRR